MGMLARESMASVPDSVESDSAGCRAAALTVPQLGENHLRWAPAFQAESLVGKPGFVSPRGPAVHQGWPPVTFWKTALARRELLHCKLV